MAHTATKTKRATKDLQAQKHKTKNIQKDALSLHPATMHKVASSKKCATQMCDANVTL